MHTTTNQETSFDQELLKKGVLAVRRSKHMQAGLAQFVIDDGITSASVQMEKRSSGTLERNNFIKTDDDNEGRFFLTRLGRQIGI